jgi:acyl carrier protein
MDRDHALDLIKKALEATSPGKSDNLKLETDLVKDGVVDSLDSMNFLFELETLNGAKLEAIDETFDDFRVARLIEILTAQ